MSSDSGRMPKPANGFMFILVALAAVFVFVWRFFLVPEVLELPNDFSLQSEVDSYDNFYEPITGAFSGEQRSLSLLRYQVVAGDSRRLEVKNSFNVRSLTGEPIFSAERTYGIDAHTVQHVSGAGDRERGGYLFAPRMKGMGAQLPEKSSFEYWHINYDAPARMVFQGEETLYGLELYRYAADLEVDQTKELTGVLPGVGDDKGINLDAHIELWVEPQTGWIVQYKDKAIAYYYDLKTDQRLHPWNAFHNQTTPSSAADQASRVLALKQAQTIVTLGVPAFFLLAWLLLVAFVVYHRRSLAAPELRRFGAKKLVLPLAGAVAVAVFTWGLLVAVRSLDDQEIQVSFHKEAGRVSELIAFQLDLYASMLRGGRGLFDASNEVSREEWRLYVESLALSRDYPGIQGLGFSKVIDPDDVETFVESVRQEGFPDFSLRPDGQRVEYTSIVYIEPFDALNQRAFGFDMFSEAVRRDAMNRARESKRTSVSGKVTLLQENSENKQAGFLMYEAVYKPEKGLLGYVYAPFRMSNLMRSILSKSQTNLGIEIFDGGDREGLSEDRLMFKNEKVSSEPYREEVVSLPIHDHHWTIRYTVPEEYGMNPVSGGFRILLLALGLLLSSASFVVLYMLNTGRARAIALAESMTKDLNRARRDAEERADVTERLNALMVDRELKMVELKKELERNRYEP